MNEQKDLTAVFQATNQSEADSIRVFLESFDIPVQLIGESIGRTMGFTVGPMGEVTVFVPTPKAGRARDLIARLQAGEFELPVEPTDQD